MRKTIAVKTFEKVFSFNKLSIKQRLPLLICLLLLTVVTLFSWTSYYGVRKAALDLAKNRLHTLTTQLGSMFAQSAMATIAASRSLADKAPIKEYLKSNGRDSAEQSLEALKKMRFDSSWVLSELLDHKGKPVLSSVRIHKETLAPLLDSVFAPSFVPRNSFSVGKLYFINDTMYYPIVIAVTDNKHTIGYLVRWKLNLVNAKSIEQFSELLGAHAALYVGNDDGTLWTDLTKPFPLLPVDTSHLNNFFEYTNSKGDMVIASAQPVANTHWIVLIEFSRKIVLEGAYRFLKSIIPIGIILVIIGIFIARIMSRNITKPLDKLTAAASSLAQGNYSASVYIHRYDEIGKLSRSFNIMAQQVSQAKSDLEKKVRERTAQLEKVNKELEAFSYSVSHDLRTPLRAINGFSHILKEDHAANLSEEGNLLTDKIIANAKMMEQLIDDLISFSHIARKDIKHVNVDMNQMVRSTIDELMQHQPENKYRFKIHDLPPCYADKNLIRQVWVNLISNAIKYSSKQPDPFIEINAEKVKGVLQYYIKDNGVGFDMKYADKLFGVFQRLHSKEEFDGTGIGMALSKRIINYHNGDIWASSAPHNGATFYFSICESES